ncbi:hypothetical protein OIU78_018129, partial [Salix suchowensis]
MTVVFLLCGSFIEVEIAMHLIGTDGGGRHACDSTNVKTLLLPVASKCGKCGSNACSCSLQIDPYHTNSDISSERSSGRDQNQHACSTDTSKLTKSMPVTQMSKSDPDS